MSNLPINERNGVLLVDSRLLAQELGVQHRSFYQKLILKYQKEIEEDWEVLRFEIAKPTEGSQGGRPERYALLTEQQSYLVLTYSKNTPQARQCKRNLVKAFDEAKKLIEKVIPAQTQELERLRLENQNLHLQVEVAKAQKSAAEAQERLMAASSALAIINPGLPALVLGRPDAVLTKTEVIEKTVLVNSKGKAPSLTGRLRPIAAYEGISKTKLAQRFGMKKARDLVDWLQSIGKEDVLESGLMAAPCQYIPWSKVAELDRLWAAHRGTRQFLIGEV